MESGYVNFRKAKVGGFNKKDVISYIEKMRNDFYDYKKAVESTIDRLNAKINELEAASAKVPEQQIKEVIVEVPVAAEKPADPIADINEATSQLRMVADELCKNISDLISKINTDGTASCCDKTESAVICDEAESCTDESSQENTDEASEGSGCDEASDKVASILNASASFSFTKDRNTESDEAAPAQKETKSILDSLSTSSFFN